MGNNMQIKATDVQKIIIASAIIGVVIGATLLTMTVLKHQHLEKKP